MKIDKAVSKKYFNCEGFREKDVAQVSPKGIAAKVSAVDLIRALLGILPQMPQKVWYLFRLLCLPRREPYSWALFWEEQVRKNPSAIALKGDVVLTYDELNRYANQIARCLKEQGVTRGAVVPLLMGNSVNIVLFFTALAKIGATASLIPTSIKGKSLLRALEAAPCTVLLIGDDFSERVDSLSLAPTVTVLRIPEFLIEEPIEFNRKRTLFACLNRYAAENLPETAFIEQKESAAYIFTSGTTGMGAKAAVITHQRLLRSALWFGKIVQRSVRKDTFYSPLPFYHSSSLVMGWPSAVAGGASYVIEHSFHVSTFWQQISKWNVTVLLYVGEMLTYLLQKGEKVSAGKSTLERLLGNGLRVEIWDAVKREFGVSKVYEMYGATESTQVFSNLLNINYTIGMNFESYRIVAYDQHRGEIVRGVDGYAQPVKPGAAGLFVYPVSRRSFKAYLRDEDTAQKLLTNLFEDGDCWFNSGDILQHLGFRHARFIDRVGDTYRWKGENSSTREVESLIYEEFSDIHQVVVYGVSVPEYDGRAGMVALVTDNSEVVSSLGELFISELIPASIPRFIRLLSFMDCTESFKHYKAKLREEGASYNEIDDPLFVWHKSSGHYLPLTAERYRAILCGEFLL